MSLVVDTSVALKWFVAEERDEAAKSLLASSEELIAPAFAYAEIANALWRKERHGEISSEQADAAIAEVPDILQLRELTARTAEFAYGLARQLEHSVYDCIFLATALEDSGHLLVTDDERFAEKVATNGYGDKIRRLANGPIKLAFSDSRIEALLQLYRKSRAIIDSVASQVGEPISDNGLRIYSTSDLRPALESPIYVRLKNEISALTPHQAATLLAIAWLGRGYDGNSFERLYEHAASISREPARHAPYIISMIGYLERGTTAYYRDDASNRPADQNDG